MCDDMADSLPICSIQFEFDLIRCTASNSPSRQYKSCCAALCLFGCFDLHRISKFHKIEHLCEPQSKMRLQRKLQDSTADLHNPAGLLELLRLLLPCTVQHCYWSSQEHLLLCSIWALPLRLKGLKVQLLTLLTIPDPGSVNFDNLQTLRLSPCTQLAACEFGGSTCGLERLLQHHQPWAWLSTMEPSPAGAATTPWLITDFY